MPCSISPNSWHKHMNTWFFCSCFCTFFCQYFSTSVMLSLQCANHTSLLTPWAFLDPSRYLFLPLRLAFTLSKFFCLSLQVSLSPSLCSLISVKRETLKSRCFRCQGPSPVSPHRSPVLSSLSPLSYTHCSPMPILFSPLSPVSCLSLAVVLKFWHCVLRRISLASVRDLLIWEFLST